MLPVDVGDDGEAGAELQKGAVALVRLGHDHLPVSQPGVAPDAGELAADHHRRIQAAVGEERRHHRSRRRLSVAAGDGDGELHLQELGEHFGPRDDRDAALVGRDHLGVVRPDGRGGDDDVGVADMGGVVAPVDRGAQVVQTLGDIRRTQIRAADLVAQIEEDLGDPAHADAADPDEVDAPDLPFHGAFLQSLFHILPHVRPAGRRSSTSARQASTISSAARRLPRAAAAVSMFRTASGLRDNRSIADASSSPLRSFSAIISAAPARARISAFFV